MEVAKTNISVTLTRQVHREKHMDTQTIHSVLEGMWVFFLLFYNLCKCGVAEAIQEEKHIISFSGETS